MGGHYDGRMGIAMQRSLFVTAPADPAPPAPPAPLSPPKYRVPLEKHPVKSKWGEPDKDGNLFWQKMHKELEKLPKPVQEFFNYITQNTLPEHLDGLEKALRMFSRANDYDKIDFDESRGRL